MDQASVPEEQQEKEQVDRRVGEKQLRAAIAEELRKGYILPPNTSPQKPTAKDMIEAEKRSRDPILELGYKDNKRWM